MTDNSSEPLKRTPLHALHSELGGKMVPFAGYDMPVQFPAGIMAEHRHTRAAASLFDVSHMGQAEVTGADAVAAVEGLVPGDIAGLEPSTMRYTQLTNDAGGIEDDLMVTRQPDRLFLVVNGATKDADFALIETGLAGSDSRMKILESHALMALQGPAAADVLARFDPACRELVFLSGAALDIGGIDCYATRSGYTGEDGFEIFVPKESAIEVARKLLAETEVEPAGLGARDSLRLEAGMCLYGHDIDATTTPVEAGLTWSIGKRRREEANFPGAEIILQQIRDGAPRKRVGIQPEGRAPAREGAEIQSVDGKSIGKITSGGFGPTVEGPVAMGYVAAEFAKPDTPLQLLVRGKPQAARVVRLPFVKPSYVRD